MLRVEEVTGKKSATGSGIIIVTEETAIVTVTVSSATGKMVTGAHTAATATTHETRPETAPEDPEAGAAGKWTKAVAAALEEERATASGRTEGAVGACLTTEAGIAGRGKREGVPQPHGAQAGAAATGAQTGESRRKWRISADPSQTQMLTPKRHLLLSQKL